MRSQEHGQNQLFLYFALLFLFSASLTCLYNCNQHYKRCYSQQRPGIHPGTPHDCVLKEKIETLEQHFFFTPAKCTLELATHHKYYFVRQRHFFQYSKTRHEKGQNFFLEPMSYFLWVIIQIHPPTIFEQPLIAKSNRITNPGANFL